MTSFTDSINLEAYLKEIRYHLEALKGICMHEYFISYYNENLEIKEKEKTYKSTNEMALSILIRPISSLKF